MASQARVQLSLAARSPRALGLGIFVLVAVLILEAAIDARLTRQAEAGARRIALDSIRSVELVDRIARAVNQQRVLIDDHIDESAPSGMAVIESRLADVTRDLQEAKREYADLTELPNEAMVWEHIQGLLGQFDQAVARMLALSRLNQDERARAELKQVRAEYQDIDRSFEELVRINRSGATDSMKRIAGLRRETDDTVLAMRVIELLALAALGWWGARRIADYERQILERNRLLEDRNGNLDAFAGRVAHDLKNTLAPTILWPSVLRRSAEDAARVREIADNTERCSVRAVAVVDALLAFSRAAHEPASNESASVRAAVAGVLDEVGPEVERLDVSVGVGLIPEARVRCSADLLHIALANVVGNAVKYLQGRTERMVRIGAEAEEDGVRIDIADTGPGIPPDEQERIFEPFYRVNRSAGELDADHIPGTGIGLATVRRIVETRGGRVDVHSVEGHGSLFSLWFPHAAWPIDEEAQGPRPGHPSRSGRRSQARA